MILNNPSIAALQTLLDTPPKREVRIQFSAADAYNVSTIELVNEICRQHGAAITVRFYCHYFSPIDCVAMSRLTSCRALFLDSQKPLVNVEAIASLPMLDVLGINIFEGSHGEILNYPSVRSVRSLYVGTNRNTDWDLAPLREFTSLRMLSIEGQHRSAATLGEMEHVETLCLNSMSRKASLDFVSTMDGLRKLKIVLGGREHLGDLTNSGITELEVIWVKGLGSLDCGRFPGLEILKIENQARIVELDLTKNTKLQRVYVNNCKILENVDLDGLQNLTSLFIGRTAVLPERFLNKAMPPSLTAVNLYGYGRKRDAEIAALLRSRGYKLVHWDLAY